MVVFIVLLLCLRMFRFIWVVRCWVEIIIVCLVVMGMVWDRFVSVVGVVVVFSVCLGMLFCMVVDWF